MKTKVRVCTNCRETDTSGGERCETCGGKIAVQELNVNIFTPKGKIHGEKCVCMVCPQCGATEVDDCRKPIDEWKWQIKPFKVDDQSHCLKCGYWFGPDGN